MTKEELIDLISKLEPGVSKDTALFEIYQYGGGPDESFVKANQEGLQLFAIELLKASLKVEQTVSDPSKTSIQIEHEEILENGDIGIHYIEPTLEKRQPSPKRPPENNWKDTLIKGGCISIAVIIIVATIIGLISIFKWLF